MVKKCSYCGTVNFFNKTGFCKNCDHRLSDDLPKKTSMSKVSAKPKITTSIIDSKLDSKTLIERLRAMTDVSRSTDKSGKTVVVHVEKNGKFSVDSDNNRAVFVSGSIYDENGKARILIEENYMPATKFQNILYIVATLLITALYLILKPVSPDFAKANMFNLIALIIVAYSLINQLLTNRKNLANALEDLKTMKGEVIRRVRAAEKWDD